MSLFDGIKSFFGFTPKKVENETVQETTSQTVVQPAVEKEPSIWTSQQKLQVEDFTQMFRTPNEHTVVDVELSQERKNELLKRIADFETYKASLSKEKQQELTDNRRYTLDAYYNQGKKKKEFRNLEDVQKLVEDFKSGKLQTLTNEDIAQIMSYTDTSDLEVDGKIGSFNQGLVGDCWFLSMLNNYAQSPEGAKNIADRIKDNKDGTYSVTFDNPVEEGKKIKYDITDADLQHFGIKILTKEQVSKMTQEEKENYPIHYSSGDKDVRIFEKATEKLLKDYISDDDENCIAGGLPLKRAVLHKAMGYNNNIVIYERNTKDDEDIKEGALWAQKYCNDRYQEFKDSMRIFEISLDTVVENGKLKLYPILLTTTYNTLSDAIRGKKAENLTFGTYKNKYNDNEKDNRYISDGHELNVEAIDDEKIVINDPYNSAFPHALPKEKLDGGHFMRVTYYPTD